MQGHTVYSFGFQNLPNQGNVQTSNLVVQSQSQALAWDSAKYNENAEQVKMKRLPFFDVHEVLLKSQCLAPNVVSIADASNRNRRLQARYTFGLTVQQAALIANSINYNKTTNKIDYGYEIQLRFAVLDPKSEQDDNFPPSVFIRVNNKPVTLPPAIQSNYPGVAPRQPSVPLNITDHVKLKPYNLNGPPNLIHIFWMPDILDRKWVFNLCLVQRLTPNDLLKAMLVRGNFKSEVTRQLINSKMTAEADDDMALTSLKVSVTCPLGKSRMTLPCRASTCSHIQCFDALLYLQMTEKKPAWNCPVCHKELLYENLAVDGFFVDVLKNLPQSSGNDIEIMPDGSWKSLEDSGNSSHSTTSVPILLEVNALSPKVVPIAPRPPPVARPTRASPITNDDDDDDVICLTQSTTPVPILPKVNAPPPKVVPVAPRPPPVVPIVPRPPPVVPIMPRPPPVARPTRAPPITNDDDDDDVICLSD